MTTGPKATPARNTHGGARPGAGRPKQTLTEKAVRKMLRTQRKWETESGKSIDQVLLELVYNQDGQTPPTVRLGAIKLWKEHTQARPRESDHKVDDAISGRTIYLPELSPDTNVTPINEDTEHAQNPNTG